MRHIWKVGKGFGKKSFEDAIKSSSKGDTLLIEPGTYHFPKGYNINELEIKGAGNQPNDVVLNGFFSLQNNAKLNLSNLMLSAPREMNALHISGNSSLFLKNVIVNGEETGRYPTIWCVNSYLNISASEIYFNQDSPYGIYIQESSKLEITSTVADSIYASQSKVYLNNVQMQVILYLENESNAESAGVLDFPRQNPNKYVLTVYSGSRANLALVNGDEDHIEANVDNGLLIINTIELGESNIFDIYHNDQSTVEASGERVFVQNIDEQTAEGSASQNAVLQETNSEEQFAEETESGNGEADQLDEEIDEQTLEKKEPLQEEEKSALEQLNEMYGLTELKKQIKQFINTIKFNQSRKQKGLKAAPLNLHSIFLGNPGTGKTTVARLLGKVLYQEGVIPADNFVEVTRKDLVGLHIGETAPKTQAVLDRARGGILFIDEAYALHSASDNDFGAEAVETILKFMEDNRDEIMIIFAGYFDDMQNFLTMNSGLASRIPNEFVFDDYSSFEIAEIGYLDILDQDYIVNEEKYKEVVMNQYGRSVDESNARWVRNFNQKLIITMANRVIEMGSEDTQTILSKDIDALIGNSGENKEEKITELLSQLNDLIGLEEIKDYVQRLVKQVKIDKMLAEQGELPFNPTYHMIFEGNPGTGKTTVANILASLFYYLDILPSKNVKVVDRADLVGSYIGHTEKNTKRIINQAMGGVLFIDEAYQLTNNSENDFGKQAVETLLTYLENYRDKFVVILAGYTKEMEKFLDMNPGLRSRIPEKIIFPDYHPDDIATVVEKNITKHWQVDSAYLRSVVSDIYRHLPESEKANARWARNFSEKLIQNHKIWISDNQLSGTEMKQISTELLDKTYASYQNSMG
ncbi:AAA family ATPase [Oceanobacillus sp. FSL W8-0428]|uniref:AAA family ATPase n=1 Tax=Oceanobacillus sp. FSL W8-0428 TaxID=2921715 RepID=UPI0030FA33E1